MNITFTEKGHVYSVNGEIASISVTELLARHKLSPDYAGVSKKVLSQKAEQGTRIHKDLESVLNVVGYVPTTEQGKRFSEWVSNNIDCGVGEQKLALEYKGIIMAGTADVMGIMKDGTLFIGDHKNTSKIYNEYVSWQVSLLDYMARKIGDEKVNGRKLNWKGAKHFYCFHYNNEGEMDVRELEKVPDKEIERLLDCEINSEQYQRAELAIEKDMAEQFMQAEKEFFEIETLAKQAKAKRDEMRTKIQALFEAQGIKSWESPDGAIKVTYSLPYGRLDVDGEKLKKDYPMVYEKCLKAVKVAGSIKVKIRRKDDNE